MAMTRAFSASTMSATTQIKNVTIVILGSQTMFSTMMIPEINLEKVPLLSITTPLQLDNLRYRTLNSGEFLSGVEPTILAVSLW